MTVKKGIRYPGAVLFLALACALLMPAPSHAGMYSYCAVPPYVQTGTNPNIMIMMDNSQSNGGPAYPVSATDWRDRYNTNNSYNYGPADTYTGYYKSELMYKYDGNKFVPSDPDTDSAAVFDGNLLNWATTSKYDLIESILVGGLSTSRQTNVNTIVGYNSGTWETRYYWYFSLAYTSTYNGLYTQLNICEIKVNENNRGDLKISDDTSSRTNWWGEAAGRGYFNVSGYECGLIRGRGPTVYYRHSYYVDAGTPGGTEYAQASVPFLAGPLELFILQEEGMRLAAAIIENAPPVNIASSERNDEDAGETAAGPGGSGTDAPWIIKKAFGFINMLFTFLGPREAEAAPLRIINPNNNATYSVPVAGSFLMIPTATGGDTDYCGAPDDTPAPTCVCDFAGYSDCHTWSYTGTLPPGLTFDTATGMITGNAITPGTYVVFLDVADFLGGNANDIKITITVTGTALTLQAPVYWRLPDGVKGNAYSGYQCRAVGGSGNYTWSVSSGSLPVGLTLDPLTGYISGTVDNGNTAGWYTLWITVSDGTTSITSIKLWFNVVTSAAGLTMTSPAFGETLPGGVKNIPYTGYTCGASSNHCYDCTSDPPISFWWTATNLPAGLTLDPVTGVISGTPTVSGTFNVTITVNDGNSTFSRATPMTIAATSSTALSATYNVRVCAGDYSANCNYNPTGEELKSGILQDFYGQARFGLIDFASSLDPNVSQCIKTRDSQSAMSNFYTDVENAVPVSGITKLIDGMYKATTITRGDVANCDPYANDPPGTVIEPCTKNFVLMITGGEGANAGIPLVFSGASTPPLPSECDSLTHNLSKNACYAYENDLRSTKPGTQNISTYVVNAMGVNGDILSETANNAGGIYYEVTDPGQLRDKLKSAFQDIIKRAASGTAASVLASGEGSGANLIQAVYYPKKRFRDSETGEQDEIGWIGRLSNFWYYVDPFFSASNMREDSVNDSVLDLMEDKVAELYYDSTTEKVMAKLFSDTDGTGDADVYIGEIEFESMGSLWEAGSIMWGRDVDTDPRTIYVNNNLAHLQAMPVLSSGMASNAGFRTLIQAADAAEAEDIIDFTMGKFVDSPDYRDRRVKLDLNGDGDTLDQVDLDGDGIIEAGEDETDKNIWKLGDVVNSTPKIISPDKLHRYDENGPSSYGDSTYQEFYEDTNKTEALYPLNSSARYQNRGMVFTGGNDGMLHAFKLGTLKLSWAGQGNYEKAKIEGTDIGHEMWAFIPKNALPYLKYIADSDYERCHIFTVDLSPYIFDASIGKDPACAEANYWDCDRTSESWRTILIGGMRTGGACKPSTAVCTDDMVPDNDTVNDCVKAPIAGAGMSSYFALDITDPEDPKFLWEFSHPQLGYSTTGPAIVKIATKPGDINGDGKYDAQDGSEYNKNGRWYAVFGSGPTGPILNDEDKMQKQFMGFSDQNLRLFVLDVESGQIMDYNPMMAGVQPLDTGIPKAFASSMIDVTNDSDVDYQDDAVYFGYVKKAADGTWTQGGVGRLFTYEDMDFKNWRFYKVIDDIGPVSSSIAKLQDDAANELWLFFATGRYFYKTLQSDDPDNERHLFGVMDPCFNLSAGVLPFDASCDDSDAIIVGAYPNFQGGDLDDMTDLDAIVTANNVPRRGWFIQTDSDGLYTYMDEDGTEVENAYDAERVITDPMASLSGVVYFTSFKPYTEHCSVGGKSFIWAVEYDTGGDAGALLKGTALIQVSTGAIEKVDLSTAFTDADGRKSGRMEGVPPTAQGFSVFSAPESDPRVLNLKEK